MSDEDFEGVDESEAVEEGGSSYSPQKDSPYKGVVNKTKHAAAEVGDKAGKTVENVGKTVKTTGKGVEAAGKMNEAAGKGIETAGKGAEAAGKGMQTAGKGIDAAGQGVEAAGNAAGAALSAIPYVGTVLGGATKAAGTAAGKTTQVAGKGTEVAGRGTEAAGKGMQQFGQNQQQIGKKMQNTGSNLSKKGDNIAQKGKDLQDASKKLDDSAKSGAKGAANVIKKAGKKIIEFAKDPKKALLKLKLKLTIGAALLGVFLAIIIVEMVVGFLIEVFQHIDEAATKVADFDEKISSLANGFGFQNTKDAFYDEIDDLSKKYDYQLDIPLLLSTLFYPDMYRGYGADYSGAEAAGIIDESANSNQYAESSYQGLIPLLKAKIKEKVDESNSTVDENGLTYTIGKIYRLRKLARNQFSSGLFGVTLRDGEEKTESLNTFLNTFKEDFKDMLCAIVGVALGPIKDIVDAIISAFTDGSYTKELVQDAIDAYENLGLSARDLLGDIFIGFWSITDVSVDWTNFDFSHPLSSIGDMIQITFHTYKYDEDAYKAYLRNYYIPNMPEYSGLIPKEEGEGRDKKITQIINDIYTNKETFKQIFLQNAEDDGEDYSDVCLGAIDNTLVKELRVPVDATSFTFDDAASFGATSSGNHNGVDITESNAGIKKGDSVYAIASGEVEDVGEDAKSTSSSSSSSTKSSVSNFLFIGDSRINGISGKLSSYGTAIGVDSSTSQNWMSVTNTGSGKVRDKSVSLPSTVSGVSVMLGVNDLNTGNLQKVAENLHNKYPDATIYINSVYHVNPDKYKGSATNTAIDSFNTTMKTYCDSQSWATYIDVTSGLDEGGKLKSSYSSDGLHLTSDAGKTVLVNNIVNSVGGSSVDDDGGAWVKISHAITISGTEYKFYSVYKNLDPSSVTLKKKDKVAKEDVIGKIGETNSGKVQLHFEFRNDKDSPIDPTNLFIVCVTDGVGELYGDTNEEKLWNYYVGSGYTKFQVAAMLGNILHESGFRPDNAEDCAYNIDESALVAGVDNGTISKDKFLLWPSNGCEKTYPRAPYTSGAFGFGISQWTATDRKTKLYDKAKANNASIADLATQVAFLKEELDGSWLYPTHESTWKNATSESNIGPATEAYCKGFEIAAGCSGRVTDANNYYTKFKDNEIITGSSSTASASGNSIIAEAKKYVGNPYVYGGSSLTNGCDCSHFVWLVLQKLGYNVSYQTAGNFNQCTQVALSDAQPGDIFQNSQHMGFIGDNDLLIEAKGAAYGITNDRKWSDYKASHSGTTVCRMSSNKN